MSDKLDQIIQSGQLMDLLKRLNLSLGLGSIVIVPNPQEKIGQRGHDPMKFHCFKQAAGSNEVGNQQEVWVADSCHELIESQDPVGNKNVCVIGGPMAAKMIEQIKAKQLIKSDSIINLLQTFDEIDSQQRAQSNQVNIVNSVASNVANGLGNKNIAQGMRNMKKINKKNALWYLDQIDQQIEYARVHPYWYVSVGKSMGDEGSKDMLVLKGNLGPQSMDQSNKMIIKVALSNQELSVKKVLDEKGLACNQVCEIGFGSELKSSVGLHNHVVVQSAGSNKKEPVIKLIEKALCSPLVKNFNRVDWAEISLLNSLPMNKGRKNGKLKMSFESYKIPMSSMWVIDSTPIYFKACENWQEEHQLGYQKSVWVKDATGESAEEVALIEQLKRGIQGLTPDLMEKFLNASFASHRASGQLVHQLLIPKMKNLAHNLTFNEFVLDQWISEGMVAHLVEQTGKGATSLPEQMDGPNPWFSLLNEQQKIETQSTANKARVREGFGELVKGVGYLLKGQINKLHQSMGVNMIDARISTFFINDQKVIQISKINDRYVAKMLNHEGQLHNEAGPSYIGWDSQGSQEVLMHCRNGMLHNTSGAAWETKHFNQLIKYWAVDGNFNKGLEQAKAFAKSAKEFEQLNQLIEQYEKELVQGKSAVIGNLKNSEPSEPTNRGGFNL